MTEDRIHQKILAVIQPIISLWLQLNTIRFLYQNHIPISIAIVHKSEIPILTTSLMFIRISEHERMSALFEVCIRQTIALHQI
jgi:hypothetical protein